MSSTEQQSFEVGEWVVRGDTYNDGWGPRRVTKLCEGITDNTYGFYVAGDDMRYWSPHEMHRLATPEEIEARPLEKGDWTNMRHGSPEHVKIFDEEHSCWGNQARCTCRHATPAEYREATQAACPEVVFTVPVQDPADVSNDWNAAPAESSDLEDSHADELTLDPLAVEAQLAEHETQLLRHSDCVIAHGDRLKAVEGMAAEIRTREQLRQIELRPPEPELPPLLYDRITGEGPYIEIGGLGDCESEPLPRLAYYAGGHITNKPDGLKVHQAERRLWPQTLTPHKPEPEAPAKPHFSHRAAIERLQERAEKENSEAHYDGWKQGERDGLKLGRLQGKIAGKRLGTASLIGTALLGLTLGVAGALGVCYWQGHDAPSTAAVFDGDAGSVLTYSSAGAEWVTITRDGTDSSTEDVTIGTVAVVQSDAATGKCETCSTWMKHWELGGYLEEGPDWERREGHMWLVDADKWCPSCPVKGLK